MDNGNIQDLSGISSDNEEEYTLLEHKKKPAAGSSKRKKIIIAVAVVTGLAVLAVTVFLLLTMLVIPKTIQNTIDAAPMTVNELLVTPTANETVFDLLLSATIGASTPVSAVMNPAKLTFWYKGAAMASTELQTTRITSAPTTTLTVNSQLDVTDIAAFVKFTQDALSIDEVTVTIQGDTSVVLMGLTYPVNLNKSITIPGTSDSIAPYSLYSFWWNW